MDLKQFFAEQFKLKQWENDYSDSELKQYSKQDRTFIEYLQIQYGTDKQSALRKYEIYNKDIKTNAEKRKAFFRELKEMYEELLKYANNPTELKKRVKINGIDKNITFLQEFDKSGYKNALRGIPQSNTAKDRFRLIDNKSRRYFDTLTGKDVSKRQRDKIVREMSIEEYKQKIVNGEI